jgi:hypothetical protein
MVTQQDRQRVIELVDTARASGASLPETVQLIHKELPHLTVAEVKEICRVSAEEKRLDAAVYMAQGRALQRIAEIIEETGQPNFEGAYELLAARAQRGDHHATELLQELGQTFTTLTMSD